MSSQTIAAEHILCAIRRQPVWGSGEIRLAGAEIQSIENGVAGSGRIALPALVNAHDHGRGLSTALAGAPDGPLELWLASLVALPQVDPYTSVALRLAHLARAGIGTTNLTYDPARLADLPAEARAAAQAARDVGLRVSLCLPVADRNLAGYGDPAAIAGRHSPRDWSLIEPAPLPSVSTQISTVDAIAAEIESPLVVVSYHAIGQIWLSREGLVEVADAARRQRRGVYMHMLETRRQRAYLDQEYQGQPLRFLDRIGLLGPHLSVAHAVWLRPDEIELLAERGVTVSVNTASNLRLRSGLAPVAAFVAAGLRFGIGLDSLGLADSADLLALARLTHLLHAGTGLSDLVSFADCLRAVTCEGYGVWRADPGRGQLAAGSPADIVLLDVNSMAPGQAGEIQPLELLTQRAAATAVTDLFVAGRHIVASGVVQGVDEPALARTLLQSARGDRETAARHRLVMDQYYRSGAYLQLAPASELLLVNGRLADGSAADIHIQGERIAAIVPRGTPFAPAIDRFDAANSLVLPSFIDGHVHLDKTLLGAGWVGNTASTDIGVMVGYERSVDARAGQPIGLRARALIERAAGNGTGWLRSHIDIDPGVGLARLEAVRAAASGAKHLLDTQLVAFPQQGVLARPGTLELLDRALSCGASVLGGMDPHDVDGSIAGQLDALFALAERHDVPLDIHLHNPGQAGLAELDAIAARTLAHGLHGRVVVSHALSLGALPWEDVAGTARELGRAGISVMTCVPGNAPIPPIKRLRDAGVIVFAASDNIRDAWSPFGDADMLRRAMLLAYRLDWNADDDLELALELITHAPARALGLAAYGLSAAYPADIVVVPANSVAEAVADPRPPSLVLKRGQRLNG